MVKSALVFLIFLVFVNAKKEDELVAVVTLFRHGDRSPVKSFPNDTYFNETYWPMGYGQLTNAGKLKMYALGKWFRKRYKPFLQEKYSPKDIYIRSTDPDRCLMSAYSVAASLFPPKGRLMWNRKLSWQPIPVHTTPIDNDEVLSMSKPCSKYRSLLNKTKSSEYVRNITLECSDIFQQIAKHSGWKDPDISDVATLYLILDAYSSYNKSFIPSWIQSLDKKRLSYLTAVDHQRYTLTPELKRLLTGPFWFNFLSHLDNVVNNVSATPKFLMLSAHDRTIVSLLNCMDVYDMVPPPFGAALIWELRRSPEGKHYINLLYKKASKQPVALCMKDCGTDCEYEVFRKLLAPVTVDSSKWEVECDNDLPRSNIRRFDKKPFFT